MSSDCDSDDSDYGDELPPDIIEAVKEIALDSLPPNSKRQYTAAYNAFKTWRSQKKTTSFVEEVFIAYFKELSEKHAPPTLWTKFSMIKTCVKSFDHIDISNYHVLIAFIKRKNAKYQKKKAKVFEPIHIRRFLNEAPDEIHLCKKVNHLRLFTIYECAFY